MGQPVPRPRDRSGDHNDGRFQGIPPRPCRRSVCDGVDRAQADNCPSLLPGRGERWSPPRQPPAGVRPPRDKKAVGDFRYLSEGELLVLLCELPEATDEKALRASRRFTPKPAPLAGGTASPVGRSCARAPRLHSRR